MVSLETWSLSRWHLTARSSGADLGEVLPIDHVIVALNLANASGRSSKFFYFSLVDVSVIDRDRELRHGAFRPPSVLEIASLRLQEP